MQKQDVIVLHGWGLSAQRFSPLTRDLQRRGFRVFVPDLPGFGAAKMPTHPLTLGDYAAFLDVYLRRHNLDHPILIGHSFGGRVALKFQNMYPNTARALILSGTPGFTPVPKQQLMLFIALAKVGKAFFLLPPFSFFADRVRRWYYYLVGAKEFYRAQGAMRETFKNVVGEKLVSAMQAVKAPCLLLWGKNDMIVPLAIAQQMQTVMAQAKLEVVMDADHGLPYKNPRVFANYCESFLRSL